MNLLLQILTAGYELGILPFGIGAVITFLWKGRINPFSYMLGYFIMFAVFWMLAVPMICLRVPLEDMTLVWELFSIGMGVVFFLFCACNLLKLREWVLNIRERLVQWEAERSLLVVFCLVIMMGAVVWVTPSQDDDTAEVAAIIAETGTVYEYQPYTLEKYAEFPNEKVFSPIELFYVINAKLAAVNTTEFIHFFLPFFMIPVVFAVYWQVGEYFWSGCGRKKELFVVFVTVFYSIAAYSARSLSVGALQNVWNGTSFAVACVFPITMIESFLLLEGRGEKKTQAAWHIGMILLCMVVGQLLMPEALLVNAVIIGCSIAGKIAKRYLAHGRSN